MNPPLLTCLPTRRWKSATVGLLLQAWALTAGAACDSLPCLNPSIEQAGTLFARIEAQYAAYFAAGSTTQTQPIGGDTAYYRTYAGAYTGLATYQGGLWYRLNASWARYASLDEANRQFCGGLCWPGGSAPASSFRGNVVLGSPTSTSIKANIFAPDQSGSVWLVVGMASGNYTRQTAAYPLTAGQPLEIPLDGLAADTLHYYRLYFQPEGSSVPGAGDEYSFQTARSPGKAFTFAVQGDSHPERERTQFNADLYRRTLSTAAADNPDFYVLMGDDFSVDTLDPATINAAQVTGRYTLQRPYLGLIGRSAPLFLVNGNHEQAARYLLNGTANNVAVWAQNARNSHYSQPAPDDFYTGNIERVPYIGLLRNYYAWTWGDALFVVIDPYWESDSCVDEPFGGGQKRTNLWDITHRDAQYFWLKSTLEQSRARYKFVFAHHVMGTGRGGIETAALAEWGGYNVNGRPGFAQNRPSWPTPIHQLMAANRVTIFFQGHDHIWARQQLDGVTYQTLPEPADPNYSWFNADAYLSGDRFPNTGYTRVKVSSNGVRVEYVRTWLPADEGPGRTSGSVAFSYELP